MMDLLTQNIVLILGVIGALAFFVNVVVEVTKSLPGIKKIPTQLYVIVLSIVICVLSIIIYGQIQSFVILWYYIVLAICAGFIVAYIAMYGWETVNQLWKRFQNTEVK